MKKFKNKEIRDLLNQVYHEEISFSRMVEILNEMVSEAEEKCVEDIPKPKFKVGDKVRIKDGISSETHRYVFPNFTELMDKFIGKELTVKGYSYDGYLLFNEDYLGYHFAEDWLEPWSDKPKKGDLAIFWDSDQTEARIGVYNQFRNDTSYPHEDHIGNGFKNAVKFESKEQFERLLKGEN